MQPTRLGRLFVFGVAALLSCAIDINVTRDVVTKPLSLPNQDSDPAARAASIRVKRQGILYGPGPDQNLTAYPAGPLGDALWQTDTAALTAEEEKHSQLVDQDSAAVLKKLAETGGIRSLADYSKLYDGQWKQSMGGLTDASFYTNRTSDLFFSMQRLAINPLALRRLNPKERLPFAVQDDVILNLTTLTAGRLLSQGRLFYADYRALAALPPQKGRFAAACEAYFYIDPRHGQWLPLAIKTNQGADLVYTPADAPLDWTFAKMLLGQNDAWDTPWRHFASTHLVVELPYLAAQRCMGDNHPVLGIYRRLMVNAFSLRQFIQNKLYAQGSFTDRLFSFDGRSALKYTMDLYQNGENQFRANYFPSRLRRNGLLDSPFGPPIQHFPFAEDAGAIYAAWKAFMTAFIHSHYRKESWVKLDNELACWLDEVREAGSVDFPSRDQVSVSTLIDVLTHVAYLNSVQHQAMNNNDQFISGLVPASPMAFYGSLPAAKGLVESDVLSMLPNATQSVAQLGLSAAFSRPEFVGSDRALINVFKDSSFYLSLNGETRAAAATFEATMGALSRDIAARRFGADGLCNGAPFIWRALDPKVALFAMSI